MYGIPYQYCSNLWILLIFIIWYVLLINIFSASAFAFLWCRGSASRLDLYWFAGHQCIKALRGHRLYIYILVSPMCLQAWSVIQLFIHFEGIRYCINGSHQRNDPGIFIIFLCVVFLAILRTSPYLLICWSRAALVQ